MKTRLPLLLLLVLPASLACFVDCGGESTNDTSVPDASQTPNTTSDANASPNEHDATTTLPDAAGDAARYCDLGLAHGDSVGGSTKLFDGEGNPIPSGHYRVAYVDGCMTYGGGQPFTVHAYEPAADGGTPKFATWSLVNDADGGNQPVSLPGYWIFGADAGPQNVDYDACVTLNKTAPAVEFDYDAGAPLGVRLNDSPLGDNSAGPDGGDPTWRLERFSPNGVCP